MKSFFILLTGLSLIAVHLSRASSSRPETENKKFSSLDLKSTPKNAKKAPAIIIDFVGIDDPNNPANFFGHGHVATYYNIGKYDITAEEYCAFLNAVASTEDTYGLYSDRMTSDPDIACIELTGTSKKQHYKPISGRELFPITYVSWFDAARFCNWMHNQQQHGKQDATSTEEGAYTLDGITNGPAISLNTNARYAIPDEDEWVKAATYQGTNVLPNYWVYPTSPFYGPGNAIINTSDGNEANYCILQNGLSIYNNTNAPYLTPVGFFQNSPGPYGTYDMAGDVFQWTSSHEAFNSDPTSCLIFGGSWKDPVFYMLPTARCSISTSSKSSTLGFRIIKTLNTDPSN